MECLNMKFIGIDLAWTYKNETGVCIIDNQKVSYIDAKVFSNDELIKVISDNSPSIVSVDAPLEVKNETGGRACDSVLMKTPINGRYLKLYATSRQYMMRRFGGIRSEDLYFDLREHHGFELGKTIIETYPTGIYLSLFPTLFDHKYKLSSRLSLDELKDNAKSLLDSITALGFSGVDINLDEVVTKKAYKSYEDKIDALLCAVNSYYFSLGKVSIFEKDNNGIISLPSK